MLDPYAILEVQKDATLDAIKKNYRKLARKYHPDLNPGNKTAEKKFKEVSHAFDQVGTAEARARFDHGETGETSKKNYEESFNKRRRPSYYDTQQEGGRYSYSFGDDVDGADFFENLFSAGRKGGMNVPGEDVQYKMEVDFKEAALGAEKIMTLPNGKSLKVKIPPGIESGKKLRFKGLGEQGMGSGQPGDAYVEIIERPLKGHKRKGKNIEMEVPISFLEALTGGEVEVITLDGKILVKVPAGVSSDTKLKIKEKGAGAEGSRGDLIIMLKIVMPKQIDPGLRDAVLNLKGQYDYNPRMQ